MRKKAKCVALFTIIIFCMFFCNAYELRADNKSAVWKTTGIVFETYDNSNDNSNIELECQIQHDNYELDQINELANTDGVSYCSARLRYNADEYNIQDVLDILENTEKYIHIEEDVTLYSDAVIFNRADSYMGSQWYLNTIGADKVWNDIPEPGKDVVVAVIDTGVDYTHKDIKNNIWTNEAEANGIPGYDDDHNGIIDDIYGANFATDNPEPDIKNDPMDSVDGHGTHVAGIIAMGRDNGGGRGIAYSSKVMPVKAGNSDGSFKLSAVIAALDYAVNMKADVINMSFGTYRESSVLKSMLERAGRECVLVAAAGNDGCVTTDYADENAKDVYPASYPFVIGVMAVDNNLMVPAWTNYDYELYSGVDYDIAAPGYNILSTMPNGKYAYMHGTSMATPMVSAAAAILYGSIDKSKISNPAAYVHSQITQATKATTNKVASDGKIITYPLLNIYDSLTIAPEINMNINEFVYYNKTGLKEFDNGRLVIDNGTTAEIYSGFRISNLWADVEDVRVKIKIDSTSCTFEDDTVEINSMQAVSALDVDPASQEAYSFKFSGEVGQIYNIPVTYVVEAKMPGNDTVFHKEFYDNITIEVKTPSKEDNTFSSVIQTIQQNLVNNNVIGGKVTVGKVSRLKCKKQSAKKYKNVITWNKASNAKKYIIYYSNKKNGKYVKLAVTSKKTYTHKFAKKKTFYYKIRAYSLSGSDIVYGKYSEILKVKR